MTASGYVDMVLSSVCNDMFLLGLYWLIVLLPAERMCLEETPGVWDWSRTISYLHAKKAWVAFLYLGSG